MKRRALDRAQVFAAVQDAQPLRGGWAEPGQPDGPYHYFTVVGRIGTNPDRMAMVSLCRQAEGEGTESELIDCDPLALENCMECRTALLKYRGLIP